MTKPKRTIDIRKMFSGIRAETTIKGYASIWAQYVEFAHIEKKAWERETLENWKRHLIDNTNLAPSTINAKIKAIKAIMTELERMDIIDANTLKSMRRVRILPKNALQHRIPQDKKTWLTPEQMRKICNTPIPTLHAPMIARDRAFLLTMASSGMRISEAVRVKTEDIDEQDGFYVVKNVWGKHQNQTRTVPLSTEAYHAIQDWLHLRPVKSPYVFSVTTIDPDNPERLLYTENHMQVHHGWYIVKRISEQSGIGVKVRPHDFRRFVGSQLAKKNLRVAQNALGHADIRTTAQYYTPKTVPVGVTEDLF